MSDDTYTLYMRFQTPDPGIGPRERVPMLEQELAWARERATMHRFSWIMVLVPPLCLGPVLPGIAFLLGLLVYQGLSAPGVDLDRIVGDSLGWLVLATLLFMAAWVLHNYLRDKRDPTKRFWQSMPDQGLVELEHHTLVSGISLWSNDYDPDCNTLMQWTDGKLKCVQDSGISQWILAKTAAGHWLVLKEQFSGDFSYGRVGQMPAPNKLLQPRQQLAIAFAPGTNLQLGRRFDGARMPLVQTPYWLSADELKRLEEAAHHWNFLPPNRYGVINDQDAAWVQRLVDRAQACVGPRPQEDCCAAQREQAPSPQ
ncbi:MULTISPECIES: hypothetical protein [unclassified Pseudomonas]|uniref:hypothetical protein n=1 Tax=unclassified Pseudomonas TaxID=196821 RepID=UPI0008763CD9|nr:MULTISPECIES: hypothetical protein [unclassified Pseudomonas]SCZ18900.1 hypothetical protein SAMN03159405_00143 [Pseudomonas sp. NFACC44-2]SDA47349.1 hypothetical protein SAMN03159429_00758 [Pseudomonas sp. NFACC51]SFH00657.1 hypothetical protein SAMN03159302_00142 [Pseudomonas sp. NFACC54]SFS36304.1 hypothetical protein SAMN03159306_00142 [Pseudomonas sp. NFACC48-1]